MPPLALRVARRYPVLSVALALGIMAYIQLRSPTSSPRAAVPSYATTGGAETAALARLVVFRAEVVPACQEEPGRALSHMQPAHLGRALLYEHRIFTRWGWRSGASRGPATVDGRPRGASCCCRRLRRWRWGHVRLARPWSLSQPQSILTRQYCFRKAPLEIAGACAGGAVASPRGGLGPSQVHVEKTPSSIPEHAAAHVPFHVPNTEPDRSVGASVCIKYLATIRLQTERDVDSVLALSSLWVWVADDSPGRSVSISCTLRRGEYCFPRRPQPYSEVGVVPPLACSCACRAPCCRAATHQRCPRPPRRERPGAAIPVELHRAERPLGVRLPILTLHTTAPSSDCVRPGSNAAHTLHPLHVVQAPQ
jgi:hypothetical protein